MRRNAKRWGRPRDDGGGDQRRARMGGGGFGEEVSAISASFYSMIQKGGYRLSEKIMPDQSALTIDSVIFLASPSNIMVLSR